MYICLLFHVPPSLFLGKLQLDFDWVTLFTSADSTEKQKSFNFSFILKHKLGGYIMMQGPACISNSVLDHQFSFLKLKTVELLLLSLFTPGWLVSVWWWDGGKTKVFMISCQRRKRRWVTLGWAPESFIWFTLRSHHSQLLQLPSLNLFVLPQELL